MENVLRLTIGKNNIDEGLLKALLISMWPKIEKVHITQKASYVVFSTVEEAKQMLDSKSMNLEGYLVKVEKLDRKTRKDFKSLSKIASTENKCDTLSNELTCLQTQIETETVPDKSHQHNNKKKRAYSSVSIYIIHQSITK